MKESSSNILLIHCPDESGLIHKITGVVYRHGLNVIGNNEFVDRASNQFFMRTEFSGTMPGVLVQELHALLPANASVKLTSLKNKDIVILATKEYHCLGDLLLRNRYQELNATIKCVISNYPDLEDLAKQFNIPYYYISHEGKSREEHEKELYETVKAFSPEFIVLAKYMRILSPAFVSLYRNKIINIHHSFLPAFTGASPYAQAFARGVKIIGATAHFVNNDLDEGPIIAQRVIPVDHSHSVKEMTQAGREVEKQVLAHALNLVLKEQVFIHGNKTIIFD